MVWGLVDNLQHRFTLICLDAGSDLLKDGSLAILGRMDFCGPSGDS